MVTSFVPLSSSLSVPLELSVVLLLFVVLLSSDPVRVSLSVSTKSLLL
jgi:hypothetical protein